MMRAIRHYPKGELMKIQHIIFVALTATSLAACKNFSSGMNPRDRHPERKGEVYPQVNDAQSGNYYGVAPQEMLPQEVYPQQ